MYAFKIQINDEAPVIAGGKDLEVLNATLTGVGIASNCDRIEHGCAQADFFITVGGLKKDAATASNKHVKWMSQKELKVGDNISIEIIDTPRDLEIDQKN